MLQNATRVEEVLTAARRRVTRAWLFLAIATALLLAFSGAHQIVMADTAPSQQGVAALAFGAFLALLALPVAAWHVLSTSRRLGELQTTLALRRLRDDADPAGVEAALATSRGHLNAAWLHLALVLVGFLGCSLTLTWLQSQPSPETFFINLAGAAAFFLLIAVPLTAWHLFATHRRHARFEDELELIGLAEPTAVVPKRGPAPGNSRVFIVHGHDEAAKHAVSHHLYSRGLEPIILHEQPNMGRAIIEKFEDHADVGFAVVLMTPDDVAHSLREGVARPRARQNVVLELGYFTGRLGRDRVCLLVSSPDIEHPSDVLGLGTVAMDAAGAWKSELDRELVAAGYVLHRSDWRAASGTAI